MFWMIVVIVAAFVGWLVPTVVFRDEAGRDASLIGCGAIVAAFVFAGMLIFLIESVR